MISPFVFLFKLPRNRSLCFRSCTVVLIQTAGLWVLWLYFVITDEATREEYLCLIFSYEFQLLFEAWNCSVVTSHKGKLNAEFGITVLLPLQGSTNSLLFYFQSAVLWVSPLQSPQDLKETNKVFLHKPMQYFIKLIQDDQTASLKLLSRNRWNPKKLISIYQNYIFRGIFLK